MTATLWDTQYQEGTKVRYWPSEELVRTVSPLYQGRGEFERGAELILDIGSGTGANSRFLLEEGLSVVAIDSSPSAIDTHKNKAKSYDLNDLQTFVCFQKSMLNLTNLYNETFDGIVDVQVSQHLTYAQHITWYAAVMDMLKPGGWYFSVHMGNGTDDVRWGGGKAIGPYTFDNMSNPGALFPNNGVICLPPDDALETLLGDAGLVVKSCERTTRSYYARTKFAQYFIILAYKE